jgi:hypothetical protein
MSEQQDEPTLTFEGQFITPSHAAEMRATLLADKEFSKSALNGDAEKQQRLASLLLLSKGYQPGAGANPQGVADVAAQATERAILEQERVADTWGRHIRLTPQSRMELARGLCTREQHDTAVAELDKMKRDPAFGRRVTSGDRDAIDAWSRMNLIAAMRVAPADHKW